MEKQIQNRYCNTETAAAVASWEENGAAKTVYRTARKNYFLHLVSEDGEDIAVLEKDDALELIRMHGDAGAFEEESAGEDEPDGPKALFVRISPEAFRRLKELSEKNRMAYSKVVDAVLLGKPL